MFGQLQDRVRKEQDARVAAVARRIAHDAPKLADLSPEQLEQLARVVVAEGLKDDLKKAARLEKIPLEEERVRFLARIASDHSRRAYRAALERLWTWCAARKISALEVTPALADDWIADERASGSSAATVRLRVAGASSWFTWMERRHPGDMHNPFRGSRARPPKKAVRQLAVPDEAEISLIMEQATTPLLRAAIALMAGCGLRVGALPGLKVREGRYSSISKGKEIAGAVPEDVLKEIRRAGLPLASPFAGSTAQGIADGFRWLTGRLHGEGRIRARYSVHDLRHAYATRLYQETRDIYAVRVALNHANTAVTEGYLRSLGIEA